MKKIIAFFLAVLMLTTTLVGCGGGDHPVNKTPEELVERTMKLMFGQYLSEDDVRTFQSKGFFAQMDGGFKSYYDMALQQTQINKAEVEKRFGADVTYSYQILYKGTLSDEEMQIASAHLRSESWFNIKDLQEVREMDVLISVSGSEDVYTMGLTVMLYQNGWYVLTMENGEMEDLFD